MVCFNYQYTEVRTVATYRRSYTNIVVSPNPLSCFLASRTTPFNRQFSPCAVSSLHNPVLTLRQTAHRLSDPSSLDHRSEKHGKIETTLL